MLLSDDDAAESEKRAKELTDREKKRRPTASSGGSSNKKRGHSSQESDDEEYMADEDWELWRYLPLLQGIPEAKLRRLPTAFMFQLNSAMQYSVTSQEKLSVTSRLAANADKLHKHPIKIEEGRDNRRDVLHKARFLGGAACTATDMWLKARKVLGEKGVTAISTYDLDSVGCGGSVTPRAWLELHNPSSLDLKMRLFHMPNVANSGMSARRVNLDSGEDALNIGESLKEIVDLDGYRAALNTAREAMLAALPLESQHLSPGRVYAEHGVPASGSGRKPEARRDSSGVLGLCAG